MEHSVPGGECERLEWERHTGSSYVEQDEGQETLGKMEFSVWAEWKTANEWVITGQMSNSSKRGLVLEIQGKLQKKKKKKPIVLLKSERSTHSLKRFPFKSLY